MTNTRRPVSGGFVGKRRVELRSSITAAAAFLPLWRAGPRRLNKHTLTEAIKTPMCRPVHCYLVSFVVGVVGKLTSSVAFPADGVLPRVAAGPAAFRADDWVVLVHGCYFIDIESLTLHVIQAQKPKPTQPIKEMKSPPKVSTMQASEQAAMSEAIMTRNIRVAYPIVVSIALLSFCLLIASIIKAFLLLLSGFPFLLCATP